VTFSFPFIVYLQAMDLARESGGRYKSAFLFGPETSGLENADLSLTDYIVQIPTSPNFSSLNLAQAVNVVSYEIFRARQQTAALKRSVAILKCILYRDLIYYIVNRRKNALLKSILYRDPIYSK
jgi:tRNA C32,U32 (ribose-2'-O)-methylase TrmJ